MGKPKGCKGHQINRWRKKSNRAITPEPLGVNHSLSMNEGWVVECIFTVRKLKDA